MTEKFPHKKFSAINSETESLSIAALIMMYHSSENVLPLFPSSINLHSELCKQLLLSLSAMNELSAFMNELVERAEE
jgi:hypothetical protein